MKISVIIATRNREYAIEGCLNSVEIACQKANTDDAEIIVVDNGSTDSTSKVVEKWRLEHSIGLHLLFEPLPGLSRAHNRAMRAAKGNLFIFTDDDCCMHKDYITDLLRHDATDQGLVLRGGRVELGDPTDLPLTTYIGNATLRWKVVENSIKKQVLAGRLNGCNMTMRREIVDRVGYFDEDFGSGAYINSGGDTDYYFRAYLAGITLEYVPDMIVYHFHGRKRLDDALKLMRSYSIANGALFVRYIFKDPNLCRGYARHVRNAVKEILTGKNLCWPEVGVTSKMVLMFNVQGAIKYIMMKCGLRFA